MTTHELALMRTVLDDFQSALEALEGEFGSGRDFATLAAEETAESYPSVHRLIEARRMLDTIATWGGA